MGLHLLVLVQTLQMLSRGVEGTADVTDVRHRLNLGKSLLFQFLRDVITDVDHSRQMWKVQ